MALYKETIPFNFAGFNKAKNHYAKAEILQILKTFSREDVSLTTFKESLQPNTFNRFLGLAGVHHWNIFDDEELTKPKNKKVLNVYNYIDKILSNVDENSPLYLEELFGTLLRAPYGLNIYAADLMFIYVASFHREHLSFQIDNNYYDLGGWINSIHSSDIDFNLLHKTVIRYYDIRQKEETVNRILIKILEEDSLLRVLSLSKKYEQLLNENYLSEEIRLNIIQVKEKINKAGILKQKYLDIARILDDFRGYYSEQWNGVPSCLKKYLDLKDKWETIEKDIRAELFQIPEEWEDEFNDEILETKKFVKENFEEWFKNNHIPVNHNVEAFIAFNKRIAKSLYEMGFNSYGRMVNDNIREIDSSVDLINRINIRISESQFQNAVGHL